MHVRDTPKFEVKSQEFYFIGKIFYFNQFEISNNPVKAKYGPYVRITIHDDILSMKRVTIFANNMTRIVSSLLKEISQLMNENTDLNKYFEYLFFEPMVFKIKIGNHLGKSNNVDDIKGNKLIEYINFCPPKQYSEWKNRMRKNMLEINKYYGRIEVDTEDLDEDSDENSDEDLNENLNEN
uniref:Uncharacterized protein n=1 Tax=Strongyloides papillosus TaxID=174720 RepID=A0A0N5BMG9_STREA